MISTQNCTSGPKDTRAELLEGARRRAWRLDGAVVAHLAVGDPDTLPWTRGEHPRIILTQMHLLALEEDDPGTLATVSHRADERRRGTTVAKMAM
jgi:hypothetical protein